MGACACGANECNCFFELARDASILFRGTGTLADPYIISSLNPGYIRPAARASNSSLVGLQPGDVDNVATMTTEEFDTDNMINIGSFPTRITISTEGFYIVGGQVRFNTTAIVTQNACKIRRNGTTIEGQDSESDKSGAANIYVSTSCMVSCSVGDYFETVYQQYVGGGNYSIQETNIWALRLGDRS